MVSGMLGSVPLLSGLIGQRLEMALHNVIANGDTRIADASFRGYNKLSDLIFRLAAKRT